MLRWWWVVVIDIVFNALGFVAALNQWINVSSWVWISLAIIGLFVAQFLAFHTVRKERDALHDQIEDKERKRTVQNGLGSRLERGRLLLQQCANEREEPPQRQADEWAADTEAFLTEHLGDPYVARFRSSAGLPMTANSIFSVPHRNLWGGIYIRLARLEQFLAEKSTSG